MAHVGVRGRQVRVVRMEHQRHADRAPRCASQFRSRGGCRWRQFGARHVGETDAGLLEHRAVAQDARAATATGERVLAGASAVGGALPLVLAETGATVGALDGRADAVLQAGQVVADDVDVGAGIAVGNGVGVGHGRVGHVNRRDLREAYDSHRRPGAVRDALTANSDVLRWEIPNAHFHASLADGGPVVLSRLPGHRRRPVRRLRRRLPPPRNPKRRSAANSSTR